MQEACRDASVISGAFVSPCWQTSWGLFYLKRPLPNYAQFSVSHEAAFRFALHAEPLAKPQTRFPCFSSLWSISVGINNKIDAAFATSVCFSIVSKLCLSSFYIS